MKSNRAFAWGECKNLAAKSTLCELLRSQGLSVDERSFSVAIQDCECFTIEFDRESEQEASFEGTAAQLDTLMKDVELIAAALRAADVMFWIEITDSVENPLHYHHNRCPDELS